MRKYIALFLTVCATAIGGLLLLRLDPAVRFEAELARLEPDEALRRLRDVRDESNFHANLELLYGQLSLADGDFEAARHSFRQLLTHAGPSEEVLKALAGIEISVGDLALASVYLRQAYDLFPTQERREQLGAWYRSLRMEGAERGLLQTVEPSKLSAWEVERLSHLLMAAGRTDAYEKLLVARGQERGEESLRFKKRLLEFLIETGRPAVAVQHAKNWLDADPSPETLVVAIRSMIGRGAVDAAIVIARHGFSTAPQDSHQILPVFVRSGHGGVARLLQSEWLAGRRTLTVAEWDTLSYVAEATGDLRTLQAALASGLVHSAEPATIGGALMQFVRYRGAAALVPNRRLLSVEVQEAAPLVAAAWAGWSGNREATYRFLLTAAKAPLSEWDQAIWMSVADSLRGSRFHQSLLAGAAMDTDLRRRLRDSVIPLRTDLAETR